MARPHFRRTGRRRQPASRRARATRVLDILESAHPEATCALEHGSVFELLVATILSAQCTDERVNEVTPALFERFPSAQHLAVAVSPVLEDLIHRTGFFRAKARTLVACSRALVERHGGEVPPRMDELVGLPGVGRKTANVVLGHALGVEAGIAVDTHVLRVANRLGLASSDEPAEVERTLCEILPRERWTRASDLMIFHGRKVCRARQPGCGSCPVLSVCRWPGRASAASTASRRPLRRQPSR